MYPEAYGERFVPLTQSLAVALQQQALKASNDAVWPEAFDEQAFSHLLVNAAHDAGIPFSDQISLSSLRHSYLTFLVMQGAKLNDLEQIAGFVHPAELGRYRDINRRAELLELAQVRRDYPLNWS